MKPVDYVAGALVAAVMLLAVFYLGWPVVPQEARKWLSGAEGAAWVQAIGSIAAIVAAAIAVRWQVDHQYRQIAEESRRAHYVAILQALELAQNVEVMTEAVLRSARATGEQVATELGELHPFELVAVLETVKAFEVNVLAQPHARIRFIVARNMFEQLVRGVGDLNRLDVSDDAFAVQVNWIQQAALVCKESAGAARTVLQMLSLAHPTGRRDAASGTTGLW